MWLVTWYAGEEIIMTPFLFERHNILRINILREDNFLKPWYTKFNFQFLIESREKVVSIKSSKPSLKMLRQILKYFIFSDKKIKKKTTDESGSSILIFISTLFTSNQGRIW